MNAATRTDLEERSQDGDVHVDARKRALLQRKSRAATRKVVKKQTRRTAEATAGKKISDHEARLAEAAAIGRRKSSMMTTKMTRGGRTLTRSILCCCCISLSGVVALLEKDETKEFALAFIIGECFGDLIHAFVSSVVTPSLRALPGFTTDGWQVSGGSGWV